MKVVAREENGVLTPGAVKTVTNYLRLISGGKLDALIGTLAETYRKAMAGLRGGNIYSKNVVNYSAKKKKQYTKKHELISLVP